MKFTLLIVAAIIGSSLAQDKCINTTGSMVCAACTGTVAADKTCTACYMGFPSTGTCTALTATNCIMGSAAATCTTCATGYYLNNAGPAVCTLNPVSGAAGYAADCGKYEYNATAAGPICANCGVKKSTTAGANGEQTCNGAAATTGCGLNLWNGGMAEAGGAGAGTAQCIECATGYQKTAIAGATSHATCINSGTEFQTGCLVGATATTCTACNAPTYRMYETGKCQATGATYSAILSVVSMIVALMFANF